MSAPNSDNSAATAAIEDKALDKEDLIKFLGEDDEKTETIELEEPKKKGSKDKEEVSEEESEKELSLEEELEQELEEPKLEEELDLVAPPSRKEILAKHPTIFKDFPHLERAFYREQKYAELLPTIEDAKNAVSKADLLDKYDKEVAEGSTKSFLSTIKDNDRESFLKVIDNYLPTLYEVDQAAYYHTVGNVIKHTILSMVRDGKENSDEELQTAAAVLNNFIFGTTKFTHPGRLSQEEVNPNDPAKKKESEISQREKDFAQRQFTVARDTLSTKVDNMVKSTVDKAIDPNNSMPDKVRQSAVREVLENLEEVIERDTRFRAVFDRLWEKAIDNDYSAEFMDKIKKAYLSKAGTLLPHLIRKTRSEYLRGTSRRLEDTDNKDRKGPLPVGKTRTSASLTSGKPAHGNSKQSIPKGMTSLEYLNSDD